MALLPSGVLTGKILLWVARSVLTPSLLSLSSCCKPTASSAFCRKTSVTPARLPANYPSTGGKTVCRKKGSRHMQGESTSIKTFNYLLNISSQHTCCDSTNHFALRANAGCLLVISRFQSNAHTKQTVRRFCRNYSVLRSGEYCASYGLVDLGETVQK